MRKYLYIFIALSFASSAVAKRGAISPGIDSPWFTGPLLSPSAHVTPPGVVNPEPYYFLAVRNGQYDSDWKKVYNNRLIRNVFQLYLTVGVTDWLDIAVTPGLVYNYSHGKKHFSFSDLAAGFDFQLLEESEDSYWPALKLGLREIFPVGNYERFHSNTFETEGSGEGSYQTVAYLCAGRLFNVEGDHWLNLRFAVEYWIPSRAHVHGLNLFGGAEDTNAYIYISQAWNFDLAFELTLNKNWVIACDTVAGYETPRKFKGYPGRLETGELADFSKKYSVYFWVAPAIEYNWSNELGIITGAWFTVAGLRSEAFASWVSAVNIIF